MIKHLGLAALRSFTDFRHAYSHSALVAGMVIVLVGYSSSVAIVFAAAQSLGASTAQLASWMWALGLGMGGLCIVFSLYYKQPVIFAWSTPGAALIAASVAATHTNGITITLPQATGAFLVCAVLITLCGVTGVFARLMNKIPSNIAAAMLAGVMLRFGMDTYTAIALQPALVLGMCAAYLLGKRYRPREAILLALVVGLLLAWQLQLFTPPPTFSTTSAATTAAAWFATPVWVAPEWSWTAVFGLGIPLFLVTMASQNAPGVAAQRTHGYNTPISPTVAGSGIASLILAPFGGFALNLGAITAAMSMNSDVHPDPARRYVAATIAGILYCIVGVLGGTVAVALLALPKAFVMAIAGLALLGTIGGSLHTALANEAEREPALVTFLVTASGVVLLGVGSAFWGLCAGVLVAVVLRRKVITSEMVYKLIEEMDDEDAERAINPQRNKL